MNRRQLMCNYATYYSGHRAVKANTTLRDGARVQTADGRGTVRYILNSGRAELARVNVLLDSGVFRVLPVVNVQVIG